MRRNSQQIPTQNFLEKVFNRFEKKKTEFDLDDWEIS